jgi:hypothetical protein
MTPGRLIRAAVVGVALVASLTSCGISLQSTAEPLPANAIPAPLSVPVPSPSPSPSASPSPSPTPTPTPEPTVSRLRLWFVQEDGLAAVESDLPVGSDPALVLQSLAIGPTAEQATEGLRTVARDPLTGLALVSVASVLPAPAATALSSPSAPATGPPVFPPLGQGFVTVILSSAFSALPPAEQVLLLGQVVLSLAGSGETSVLFTDEAGSPVAVPLPDGRLLDLPATARDYSSLIVRP